MLETYATGRGKHSRASEQRHGRQQRRAARDRPDGGAAVSPPAPFLHEALGQVYDAAAAQSPGVDLRLRLRLADDLGHERGD